MLQGAKEPMTDVCVPTPRCWPRAEVTGRKRMASQCLAGTQTRAITEEPGSLQSSDRFPKLRDGPKRERRVPGNPLDSHNPWRHCGSKKTKPNSMYRHVYVCMPVCSTQHFYLEASLRGGVTPNSLPVSRGERIKESWLWEASSRSFRFR